MATFQLLQNHGFQLKKEFGEGFKRYIKFDDVKLNLVMEVKFPGEEVWDRITPEIALELREGQDRRAIQKIRDKLSAGGSSSSQGARGSLARRPPEATRLY
jgi:hypothetical protein